jgi:hypothetical protein
MMPRLFHSMFGADPSTERYPEKLVREAIERTAAAGDAPELRLTESLHNAAGRRMIVQLVVIPPAVNAAYNL